MLYWVRFLRSIPTDFKPAVYAFLIILIPSTILLPLAYVSVNATDPLETSLTTPWGVFTSIWVHYDISHYSNNMLVFLFFIFLFAFIHEYYPRDEKLRRSAVLIWTPIVSAVAANVYTLIVFPLSSSAGASGALLAYEGVCLGYAFLNAYPTSFKSKDLREHFLKRENRTKTLRGFVVLVLFFGWFALDPRQFLFVAPGVNSIAHLVGLLVGFGLTGAYEIIYRTMKGLPRHG